MRLVSKTPLLLVFAALLAAEGPSVPGGWGKKPVDQWTVEDARQVLSGSAWVKRGPVSLLPQRSEFQSRDGGRVGGNSNGVTLSALRVSIFTGTGDPNAGVRKRARKRIPTSFEVRWESGLPVRTAEVLSKEDDPPAWEGEMYAIAVYDVPGLDVDDKGAREELKRYAFLLRDGKREVRAVQVDMLPQEGDLTTVVYLFPRSAKISLEDKKIEFDAMFGRLLLREYFYPKEMQFQGKLEL